MSPVTSGEGAWAGFIAAIVITVGCTATATAAGSDCKLHTSLDALFPGAIKERRRAVWEIDQLELYDGGADGLAATEAGNSVFMRQGIFIP